jgi:hypothetical protein
MKTTDLFKNNRSAHRLNETLTKTFGKKINFETFDTEKLEDARNKLRTQIHTARSTSSFNETTGNDALTQAQWMHDTIVAELMDRQEHVVGDLHGDPDPNEYGREGAMAKGQLSTGNDAVKELMSILNDADDLPEWVQAKITKAVDYLDVSRDYMKSKHSQGVTPTESIKEGHTHKLAEAYTLGRSAYLENNEHRLEAIPKVYKNAWIKGWKDSEVMSENRNNSGGQRMRNLRESEIDQASAIVTANTMVDRLGRWIEELSGMENETLLQLGDSIRDEMGQEQSRQFIEAVAPTIQSALENLKTARESVSGAVRTLATGEAPDAMLGAKDNDGMDDLLGGAEVKPDAMNGADLDLDMEPDDFDAAEPATGGVETAGREKRESIDFQNRLLKVLVG